MALAIRPIPTLTGAEAERFVAAAEEMERNPIKEKLSVTREEVRKLMEKSKNFKF